MLLLGLPLLAACALIARTLTTESPLQSGASDDALVATVTSAERTDLGNVNLTVHTPAPYAVLSQSSGFITRMGLTPGQPVQSGDVAFEVAGVKVVAYVADLPLYRDITAGLKGDDVATAQRLLMSVGLLSTADGNAAARTSEAIRKFNNMQGRETDGTTLVVSSLLWVPTDGGTPQEVKVRVGYTVAAGDELYTTSASSPSISLSVDPADVDRVLTLDVATVPVPAGTVTITDPGAVATLMGVMGDATSGSGSLALATPRAVGVVPATAVVTDDAGRTCFFASVDATNGTELEDPSGAFGMVDVPPDMVGLPVLVNPREHRADLSCA